MFDGIESQGEFGVAIKGAKMPPKKDLKAEKRRVESLKKVRIEG